MVWPLAGGPGGGGTWTRSPRARAGRESTEPTMKSKLIEERQGERTFALVFDPGDEVLAGLRAFAKEANLTAARLTAIGAFRDVTLGFFDPDRKEYHRTVLQ